MSRLPSTLPTVSFEAVSACTLSWYSRLAGVDINHGRYTSENIKSVALHQVDERLVGATINDNSTVTVATICRAVEDIRTKVRTWVNNLTQPVLVAA